ncbi:MAG TPA: hypothetical protein VMX75_02085 [Spirochaetia bacterium]|nr:hypothetical protein [Spirochaetia bacterium]
MQSRAVNSGGRNQNTEGTLTERVLRYQNTGQGLVELMRDLSNEIYSYPRRKKMGSEDDQGNFYLYFVPRLKRLLQRYRNLGIPFEHYFHSSLYWNLKSYYRYARRREWSWWIGTCAEFWESPGTDALGSMDETTVPAEYSLRSLRDINIAPTRTGKRGILLFVLRNLRRLDVGQLDAVCEITGVERGWLLERIRILEVSMEDREKRFAFLRTRRNNAFYQSRILERRLISQLEGERRESMRRRILKLRRVMARSMDEMARVPLCPTHRAIAEALGIPKGTVDTGLRWINARLTNLVPSEKIEYA